MNNLSIQFSNIKHNFPYQRHLISLVVILCLMSFGNIAFAQWSPDTPLMPTGNSTQDVANIQAALHDSNLDNGGTLYLGPGTFLIHSSLVRQTSYPNGFGYKAIPFDGTIQGAGKDVTIIKSVRGPNGEAFTPMYDEMFDLTIPGTFFIWGQDYFGIKDLSFEAESEVADSWEYPYVGNTQGLISYVGLGSGLFGIGGSKGTDCINVSFNGSLNSAGEPEMIHMFEVYGGGGGIHTVKSCDFNDGYEAMLIYSDIDNSEINIGGGSNDKVTFSNAINSSIEVWFSDKTPINISYIETNNANGLYFFGWRSDLKVNLTYNDINLRKESNFAGFDLRGIKSDVTAFITNNKINGEDPQSGLIFTEGINDITIRSNKLSGKGLVAIGIGILKQKPGKVTMMGNNLNNWTTSTLSQGDIAAPIWLGPYIKNSLVVGGGNQTNVFDEPGYDWDGIPLPPDANGNAQTYNNKEDREYVVPKENIFTGVNNMQMNIGQIIKDKMKFKIKKKIR